MILYSYENPYFAKGQLTMGYKQSLCKPGQLPIKYIMAMKLKKNPESISGEVNEFRCSTGCGNYTPEPGQFIKCTVNFIVLSFQENFHMMSRLANLLQIGTN